MSPPLVAVAAGAASHAANFAAVVGCPRGSRAAVAAAAAARHLAPWHGFAPRQRSPETRRHLVAAVAAQWQAPMTLPRVSDSNVLVGGVDGGPEAHLPLPVLSLALLEGLFTCGGQLPRRPTEYELSLGKIADTLRSDYPALLEREPDFGIYDEAVSLEIGQPWHAAVLGIRGKEKYMRAIRTLKRLACSALSDGSIRCRVESGAEYGCALRVPWKCEGTMYLLGLQRRIHISAISSYKVAPQPIGSRDSFALSYRIRQHRIEIMDIQPPSLRSLLSDTLWQPGHREQPCFAFQSR
mmetsp:Transcript_64645/g.168101  ORF Transcript_64645/g.168101 Transcript_64645/m.168101 type:complete len:296 (-) Transcript_64645:35-922(-)